MQSTHELNDTQEEELPLGAADRLFDTFALASRHIALLAAWIATCGSLFFSEVLGWVPCELCWYQRILMYPLALILPVGILRRDPKLHLYVFPLAILGAPLSLYHYLLIKTDWFTPPRCTTAVPCTIDYINWLGFINIPLMAFIAFAIILVTMSAWMLNPFVQSQLTDADAGDAEGEGQEAAAPASAGLDRAGMAVFAIIAVVLVAFIAGSFFVG